MKSPYDDTFLISEITQSEMRNVTNSFDITRGCIGTVFKTKEPVFEPSLKGDKKDYPENTRNSIAFPIFDEENNSSGVLQIINTEEVTFTSIEKKSLLPRFAKYISLLFYTSGLLKVF